jgi:preprotein translocase subunit SecA
VYSLDVVKVPTNKPLIRKDLPDAIYKTEKGKFAAVVAATKACHQKGQPVLIGTISIEKNEYLSALLTKEGIPHNLLNAKNHEREASTIAEAGRKGAVTVATNMAGRGVDIILGGHGSNFSQKENAEVITAGGLHVIGTERHEARRIDDQLRGRSGRQGDPGSTQFFVSLEDDLMRIFGGDKLKGLMETFKVPDDQCIENRLVSRSIESAQAKIEGFNFDMRKHVLEYDDVLNKQREVIYQKRKDALKKESIHSEVKKMIDEEIENIVNFHTQDPNYDHWNLKEIGEILCSITGAESDIKEQILKLKDKSEILKLCRSHAQKAYQEKAAQINKDNADAMKGVEKYILLRVIDTIWMDHLDNMEHLRDSVRLRAYGQKDPLIEYKNEGHRMFKKLVANIRATFVNLIYKVSLSARPAVSPRPALKTNMPAGNDGKMKSGKKTENKNKLSRNDPCPCGKINPSTGKPIKYKKCCWPKYGK